MKILFVLVVGLCVLVACYGPREQRGETPRIAHEEATPPDSMPDDAEVFVMWENHPNSPFSPYTTIFIYSDTCRHVVGNLLSITRDTVDVLWDGELCGGVRLRPDLSGFASGVYFAEVNFGDTVVMEKLALLK